jgi:translation initiation factor IF-2
VPSDSPVPEGEIIVERGTTARELGPKLNRSAADVVRFLLQQGEMVTANQPLSDDAIELFGAEVGAEVKLVDAGEEKEAELQARYFEDDDEDDEDLRPRPPVITVMGHVDHGKTLLLDRIREADVVSGEAGGITQHIGAYQAEHNGRLITFIDTPGHEAFTAMRARGAQVTDIAVLVVAADDGVMPQTVEALNHAKAADVPIVVAVNKIDRDDADPNRVKQQLSEHGLVPEDWGGDTAMVEVSALQRLGIDDLLEHLVLVADVEELVANPEGLARGSVLEGYLDPGRGPMATVIVERGTLRVGDPVVMGASWGRVRALLDHRGDNVKEAQPSTPVQVLGLSEVPTAGDELRVTPDDKTARTIAELRSQRYRANELRRSPQLPAMAPGAPGMPGATKLEDIFEQIQRGETATLNLVLKADVHGSLEALTESLKKLERDEVKLNFVHRAVGGIIESDIQLASASSATVIGFNVRPDRKARDLAEGQDVEVRTYEIIYQVLEEIEAAMVGMLKPEYEEVVTGDAEVLKVFGIPRIGKIAGCAVRNGVITRGSKVRFLRDGVIIWKGAISSLRREKDDVREVRQGFECGIGLTDFQNLQEGDIIETYEDREIPRV